MQHDLYSIVRRNNRQRAWLRLMWRKRIPLIVLAVKLRYYRVKGAYSDWVQSRVETKQIEAVHQAIENSVIDPNRKCPACGAKDGTIVFSDTHEKVMHRCNVCKAICAEPPIFKYADWKVEFMDSALPAPLNMIESARRKAGGMASDKTQ